jgi:cytochrome b6-f complex iron-sulfur subunit
LCPASQSQPFSVKSAAHSHIGVETNSLPNNFETAPREVFGLIYQGDQPEMAEKISDLTGEEREQRIAELKRRMQESAKRNREAQGEEPNEEPTPAATTSAAPSEPEPQVAEAAQTDAAPSAVAVEKAASPAATPKPSPAPRTSRPSTNGSAPKPAAEPEGPTKSEMNRREFLTYTWAAALGLLALEGGVLSFQFMYPRFRAGEFGGEFFIGPVSALPAPDASPQPNTDGKFWLVSTVDDEPKALYMVCTHLGCLYQWVQSNFRFECPCHGSKFTHDGYFIEGPAPRSLDYFETRVEEDGTVVVDTGSRVLGEPAGESPFAEGAA